MLLLNQIKNEVNNLTGDKTMIKEYDIDKNLNDLMNKFDTDGIYYLVSIDMEDWRSNNIRQLINNHIESLKANSNFPSIILY